MDIYQFPPAAIVGWRLSEDRPVRRSEYALDGKRAVSSAGPTRRMLDLSVSALGGDGASAGYLSQLWRYIDGGIGLVRLNLPPVNWWGDWCRLRGLAGNRPISWEEVGTPITWEDTGTPISWFAQTRRFATVTSLSGYPAAVEVTGLPANIIVARPGDILRVHATDHSSSTAATVLDLTRSDAAGVAVVPLDAALPAGVAAFADEVSAVFEVTSYDPGQQYFSRNWTISMSLREVLDSEISGPTEIDPWR